MTTNVEFYSKLREHIPDEAAKMIAEHLVPAEQIATRADLTDVKADLKAEIAHVNADLKTEIGEIRTEMVAMEGRLRAEMGRGLLTTQRWILTLFATQWLGTVGIIVAIFLKN